MSNVEFVRLSNEMIKSQRREHYLFDRILVFIKDPLPKKINLQNVLSTIEKKIPKDLVIEVDDIFIGQFDDFVERDINAIYKDGAIYVTNNQSSEQDLLDDIVHEMAHAVEEVHGANIYYDGSVEREFLTKRLRLFFNLQGVNQNKSLIGSCPNISRKDFLNPDYSREFDIYLYKHLGYPLLRSMTANLFLTPYSVTSLREYFAIGFEEYFLKDNGNMIEKISPNLYKKLDSLYEIS